MSNSKFIRKDGQDYCINLADIVNLVDNMYSLPNVGTGITFVFDKISECILRDPDIKRYVAVEKPTKITYALCPETIAEYKEPSSKIGVYGDVYLYPTEQIANKKYKAEEPGIAQDMVKELAIYRLFEKTTCLPKLYDVSLEEKSLKFRLGLGTLDTIKLTDEQQCIAAFRLLKCLRLTSSQGIIHGDLKPINIILSQTNQVQVIDWGLAQFDQSKNQTQTKISLIQTLWYRAPEILVSSNISGNVYGRKGTYNCKVDIFSLGLIFIEMYTSKPPIRGEDEKTQLSNLLHILLDIFIKDSTDIECIIKVIDGPSVCEKIKQTVLNKFMSDRIDKIDLADLISHMLEFNPVHRWNYDQLILHPYFQSIFRERVYPFGKPIIFLNNMPIIPDISKYWENKRHRRIVFEWVRDVCVKYLYSLNTLCLSWQLIDLFMSKLPEPLVNKQKQLLACTAMSLASKLHEYFNLEIHELIYLSDDQYTTEEMINMEKNLIRILNGNLAIPTLYSYYSYYQGKESTKLNHEKYLKFYLKNDVYAKPFAETWKEL